MSQFAAQRLSGGIQLATLATYPARPRILAERVDHGAANATLGKGLELDAAAFIEPVGRIDQTDDAVLHEIADIDRVRHRCRHAARQRFNERQAGDNTGVLCDGSSLNAHLNDLLGIGSSLTFRLLTSIATSVPTAEPVRHYGADYGAIVRYHPQS